MRVSRGLAVLALLVILAAVPVAAANLQSIEDWIKLRDYTPPAEVSQLAREDTMTAKSQHLFFLNHPQLISDKTQFRQACPQSEQTIVLGCYHSDEDGIAVYSVSDSRLNGVEEVTAAHEMLHAAYDRLSASDKSSVDEMLNDYYSSSLKDQRIINTINAYKKSEPNDVVNEMHSIFGTEIASLPQPLENYYKQYFANRQAVVSFSNQYESVFIQNQQQLDSLKSEIDRLKDELNADKQNIQDQEAALDADNRRMQNLLASGKTNEYNAGVNSYNAKAAALRSAITSYNAGVQRVNALVDQYNQLAYTQENLYQSLDTRVQTQTAQ